MKSMYFNLQNREKFLNTTWLICETSCSSALAVTTGSKGVLTLIGEKSFKDY